MTAVILQPQPMPPPRTRPAVMVWVLALHLGLLWVANLYWPLQTVVKSAAQGFTVQILQRSAERVAAAVGTVSPPNNQPQAIGDPARQRFGRAETTLKLPALVAEASTPLAGTAQSAQSAARPLLAAEQQITPTPTPTPTSAMSKPAREEPVEAAPVAPAAVTSTPPPQTPPTITPLARPVTQATVSPEPMQATAPRAIDEKLPVPVPAPAPTPAPAPLPSVQLSPATAAAPAQTPAPAAVAPAVVTSPSAARTSSAAVSAIANLPNAASNSGTAAAPGTAQTSGFGTAASGAAGADRAAAPTAQPPGAVAPLNLTVPQRYLYRPPMTVPGPSLAERANEQLRRKPRDAFAESIQDAGNIDCLKDTPGGPNSSMQGLLAVGPLLKRAIEEKCKK